MRLRRLISGLAISSALLIAAQSEAATIRIPMDQDTIAAGLEVAEAGDTVLVSPGTYYERDLAMVSGVTLLAEGNDPDRVTIDGSGFGRIINCLACDASTRIEGFSIVNGSASTGAGIEIASSSMSVVNCRIANCHSNYGGGIYLRTGSNPILESCTLFACGASFGGGICIRSNSSATITNFTIAECSGYYGGGMKLDSGCQATLINTIIAFSTNGTAIHTDATATATLNCCNLYDNDDGDWVGSIASQDGNTGNIRDNPEFCGVIGSGNLYLQSDSPCAASECSTLMGALPVNCQETAAQSTTWSSLKSLY
ncbi:MAG: hypothetical protein GY835_15200 [bacterium]|nr:hypothetical protein [bacterium]